MWEPDYRSRFSAMAVYGSRQHLSAARLSLMLCNHIFHPLFATGGWGGANDERHDPHQNLVLSNSSASITSAGSPTAESRQGKTAGCSNEAFRARHKPRFSGMPRIKRFGHRGGRGNKEICTIRVCVRHLSWRVSDAEDLLCNKNIQHDLRSIYTKVTGEQTTSWEANPRHKCKINQLS